MFNLEQSIAEWRRQMLAAGVKAPATLEELESHLREDLAALLRAGVPGEQAFPLAVSRLGNPAPLRTEFNKLKRKACRPVLIGSWLWIGAVILMVVQLSSLQFTAPRWILPLITHMFLLTAGYSAAFLAGGFGICYVCYRSLNALTPVRQQSLSRAVLLFTRIAAGLAVVGVILGMLWSRQQHGGWLRGGVREIAGICASVWLVALAAMQRSSRMSERMTMLMSIGTNIMLTLAWFGAGIIDSDQWGRHAYGMINYWPPGIFLGLHLFFLVIGLAPAPVVAESN
jgi:hypothetical protein